MVRFQVAGRNLEQVSSSQIGMVTIVPFGDLFITYTEKHMVYRRKSSEQRVPAALSRSRKKKSLSALYALNNWLIKCVLYELFVVNCRLN